MSTLQYYSSVPGMAVPGMAQPGRDSPFASAVLYQYIGQQACFYLDYLDLATGHTLAPVPGGFYTMAVANPRAGLTVPPPGRPWNPGNAGAGGTFAPLFVRPLRVVPLLPMAVSHGHYPGAACGHCDPLSRDSVTVAVRMPGPDVCVQPSLGEARAALERQRNESGWHDRQPAPQPQGAPPGVPQSAPPAGAIHHARALLEESRVAHGHYAPGGCKRCMSGG